MDEKFNSAVLRIVERDCRYHADAYAFVNAAVAYTVSKLARERKPRGSRHVSGGELVDGVMDYAVAQFGFLSPDVLTQWGISRGEDIGNIVYNMIGVELLSAGPSDARSDFQCAPDLIERLRSRTERPADVADVPPPPTLD